MSQFAYGVLCGIGGTAGVVCLGVVILIFADRVSRKRANSTWTG